MPAAADEGRAAEDFAASLMDKWGVGDGACNDGVLLLLSLQPRQVAFPATLLISGPSTACRSCPPACCSWHSRGILGHLLRTVRHGVPAAAGGHLCRHGSQARNVFRQDQADHLAHAAAAAAGEIWGCLGGELQLHCDANCCMLIHKGLSVLPK